MESEVRKPVENQTAEMNKGSKLRMQIRKIHASRQTPSLKSVLLDAITHDFKTPLTSIKVVQQGGMTPVARPERELQSGIRVHEFARPWEAVLNSQKEN